MIPTNQELIESLSAYLDFARDAPVEDIEYDLWLMMREIDFYPTDDDAQRILEKMLDKYPHVDEEVTQFIVMNEIASYISGN